MTTLNWADVDKIRGTVETYYKRNEMKGNINIPMYDAFVTELRKDFERASYNLSDESDLFKLWGHLSLTCAAGAHLLTECATKDQLQGALKVLGTYGNMTGLFLREMTKNCPAIPAITPVKETPSE